MPCGGALWGEGGEGDLGGLAVSMGVGGLVMKAHYSTITYVLAELARAF